MHKLLTAAAGVLIVMAGLCSAEDGAGVTRVVLKDSATVSSDVVTLGDIAELDGACATDVATLALGNAPWPGNARKMGRILAKVRLASAGYDLSGFEFSGSDLCVVETLSERVEPAKIVAIARGYLESCFPEGGPDVQIELLRDVSPLVVAVGEEPLQFRASLSGSGPLVGTVRVDVELIRAGILLKKVPVSLLVKHYKTVAVARCRIAPGASLTLREVAFARREIGSGLGACVSCMEELADQTAARTIQAGEIITQAALRAVERPVVIQHNQRVFLVVETEMLRAVTLGKSLGRARVGEMVRVMNLSSGREVVGAAMDGCTVRVLLGDEYDEQ